MFGVPVKHGALLGVPAVGFIEGNDFVLVVGIDHANGCCFIWRGHPVNTVNFKAENVTATGIPGNGLALANVTEEMMFRTGSDLFNIKVQSGGLLLTLGIKWQG